jgi:DNA-binding LacI/PurR family transcriptional regulator
MTSAIERRGAFLREASRRDLIVTEIEDRLDDPRDFSALAVLMRQPRDVRPTTVVCWYDAAAISLVLHCLQTGIDVPGDLAIIGFDGLNASPVPSMQLTTIVAPWGEVAREAVRVLDRKIAGETVPAVTRLPVALRLGATG